MGNAKPLVGIFLILALILAGAVALAFHRSTGTAYFEPVPDEGRLSPALNVDVYVDGSGSMQNLLAGHGENYLHEFLTHCESVLRNPPTRNGWDPMAISYQKFGAKLTPLREVGALSHLANSPKDFNEPRTPIEMAARDNPHGNPNSGSSQRTSEIKIIVTDLYQSDQANEKPAIALTERFLTQPSGAVAVLGIRNPYSGPVEDLPGLHGRSLANAADSMPFYIIIAGDKAADVREIERLLIAETGMQGAFASKHAFAAFFSKDPGEFHQDLPTFNWTPFGPHGKRAVGLPEPSDQDHIESLTLRKGVVQVRWAGSPLDVPPYEIPAGQQPELRITPLVSTKKGEAKPASGLVTKAASPCDWPKSVCTEIDWSKLKTGRPYLFRFDIVEDAPSDNFRQDSPTMQPWDIEAADVEMIAGSGSKKFPPRPGVAGAHPGMTPNLSQFLSALQGQTFHEKNGDTDVVRGATYFLYVEGR